MADPPHPDTEKDSKGKCPFMKLPSELHIKIYKLALASYEPQWADQERKRVMHPGLLIVCKRTRRDAMQAFFQRLQHNVQDARDGVATAVQIKNTIRAERPDSSAYRYVEWQACWKAALEAEDEARALVLKARRFMLMEKARLLHWGWDIFFG